MKVSKIPWVSHKKFPILSVDVQPNGYRFITGGTDGYVGVWNMLPVISQKYEDLGNESDPDEEEEKAPSEANGQKKRVSVGADESKDQEMREEGEDDDDGAESYASFDSNEGLSVEERLRKEKRREDFEKDVKLMESLFVNDEVRAIRCLAVLESHSGPVNCVRWNGLGTMFASADDMGSIILWEYRG